jgi:hypothetical protein
MRSISTLSTASMPAKSYPAGTFALHDGGTVLATRATDPLESASGSIGVARLDAMSAGP